MLGFGLDSHLTVGCHWLPVQTDSFTAIVWWHYTACWHRHRIWTTVSRVITYK